MRYISKLIESEGNELGVYLSKATLLEGERKRLSAILLSSEHRLSIGEIAQACQVSCNSIQAWLNRYERSGFSALLDKNMAHKKSYLSTQSEDIILSSVDKNPQNLRLVVVALAQNHGIKTNKRQLQSYLKKKVYLASSSKIVKKSAR